MYGSGLYILKIKASISTDKLLIDSSFLSAGSGGGWW